MTHRVSRSLVITLLLYLVFLSILFPIARARIIEQPTIQVDHFVAGAFSPLICIGYPLAFILCLLPVTLWPPAINRKGIALRIVGTIVPLILAVLVVNIQEQTAAGFNEQAYTEIITNYDLGTAITTEDVLDLLGEPLSKEEINGRFIWSYTYMPSTGWGWNKRILSFDLNGNMVGYNNIEE